MNFLQRELKRILDLTKCGEEAVCIGKASYIRISGDVRLRLEFSGSSASLYDGITMTMLNWKDGPIDTNILKFKDIWGEKSVINPNFKEGLVPHIWEYRGKTEWYVYQPKQKRLSDVSRGNPSIHQYVSRYRGFAGTTDEYVNSGYRKGLTKC